MLQLCATLLNVTWVATLKMNEVLMVCILFCGR